ncbi:MAG: SEL1-like repeat protein, partial [Ruminococcus sp.]|nr:SEL1-like repeat protein [Ruminococcus sp.]
HISDIAQAQNIPLANLKWYAAFHNTTHHPHIHLIVYSTNPKQGYLTKQGIEKIRSVFANDIFQDDLKSIYQQQTLTRDELKVLSENQMKEIIAKIGNGDVDEGLVTAIEKLHKQLQTAKGKKVYGYLPKEIKQTVDEIFSMLADDEHIKQLYEKWCELESLKYKTYTLKPKSFPTLVDNQAFKSVKNMIIKAVLVMNTPIIAEEEAPPPEPIAGDTDEDTPPPIDYGDELSPDDFIFDSTDAVEVDVSDFTPPSKYTLKWSDDYKSACKLIYDKHSKLKDFQEAEKLLLSEATKGNALAINNLGKLCATDKLGAKDEERSAKYYTEALIAFMDIEPNADFMFPYEPKYPGQTMKPQDMRSYVWYRIGKMHCYGLGTEQDYTEAFKWFEKSAMEGNKFAQVSLANLYYYGNGVEQSYEQAYNWYMTASNQGQPYAAYAVAQMYANGEYVSKDESEADRYYKQALAGFLKLEADNQADDNLLYKIGRMFKLGLGTEVDVPKAVDYFKRAADLGNRNAKRTMALEYISGENVEQDVDKGINMLTELADSGDTMSAYKLGKIYLSGDVLFTDIDKAEKYLQQAADDDNEYAMYSLAKLYLLDEKKDLAKAVKWFEKACEYESIKPYAAYAYAKILLDDNEFHDTARAIELLEDTADKNNWCAYLLGKLYLFGNDEVEKDKEKAIEWLTKSAEDGNTYAEALLQHAEDYEHSMMTNTVMSLFAHLARIIEDDYMRSHRKLQSRVDRKLRRVIEQKKEELGIKTDNTIHYDY